MKILFQGDSITDAGRDRRNYHDMGTGYPKYASELISANNSDTEFEFINFGISGNRTGQLFDRLYYDAIVFKPDIISILIGVNDVWHRHNWDMVATTDEQIELNYRCILERIKSETNAKIVILSPYLLDCPDHQYIREGVNRVIPIVKALADKYADAYIPLDEIFAEAMKTQPVPMFYSDDGVHPNENGSRFIGELYAKAVQPIIESL